VTDAAARASEGAARPSTAPHAVEVRGLTVRVVGGATLLDGVDLDVAPGEHVLLVGPSGAGKSTLLRAVAGLVAPTEGTIRLAGDLASDAGKVVTPPADRGVGFLFQGAALWPHLSVAGTLDFVLKRRGRTASRAERKQRIAALLDAVDLSGYGRRRAPSLSGGEAQRLSLARALAVDPKVLLLDEPLGPLDAPRREALLDLFHRLTRERGLATIHVTHDPAEAGRIADRTLHMEPGGRIAAGGG